MQSFPFDSQLTFDDDNLPVYDRAVSSQPLRTLIGKLFTTGVMPNPSTNLQVSSGTDGMTVQVQAGFAVVDGGLCQETETRTLEVTAADTTYDRIDTVVLRWDENVDVRTADLYVVAGTPSATPVRPTLQRDNSIYEIGLADVFITKNVATITDEKITDTRYEDERCGVVSSVSEWDTTTIYQQIQAELAGFKANEEADFTTWFEEMKDQLSEDAAGNLQLEIDEINDELQPVRKRTITNLLNPTLENTTSGEVTCTSNGDGTYTINGTTDTTRSFFPLTRGNGYDMKSGVTYKLCGCPEGGSSTTYALYAEAELGTEYKKQYAQDYGDGTTFTVPQEDIDAGYKLRITISIKDDVDNIVFKPMLTTDLYASYDEFVQYSGDGELNENVAEHEKQITQIKSTLSALGESLEDDATCYLTCSGYTGSTYTLNTYKITDELYFFGQTLTVTGMSPSSAGIWTIVCHFSGITPIDYTINAYAVGDIECILKYCGSYNDIRLYHSITGNTLTAKVRIFGIAKVG